VGSALRRAWDRTVISGLLDHAMAGVSPLRGELLREARGRVIEIGLGNGANLAHFGDGVEELVAIEPSEGLAEIASARLATWASSGSRARRYELIVAAAGEELPVDPRSFDAAVITFVLCTVPDPGAVLRGVRRALRPGAPLLVLEHVASRERGRRALQQAIRPVYSTFLGCDPARDTRAAIVASGLRDDAIRDVQLSLPFPISSGIIGRAIPSSDG
jgi:SAM-dependent methyltransferase